MEQTDLTKADEGKPVVNASGDNIGTVAKVVDGQAHIDPDPGITETITSKLGWSEGDDEYALDNDRIERVTDEEIRLKD